MGREFMRRTGFPHRWQVVILLFFLSVINYLDRQSLSVLAPTLRTELGFSTVEYSYVVTSFLVAYTIGYFFCGRLIDQFGVRLMVIVALSVWSVAGMLHAAMTSWVGLAVARFVLGLGESFNAPCGMKAIAEWVPRRERGLSMAIFSNGNMIGAILAPPLVAFAALRFGWQWGFIATGLAGFVYLIFWIASYHSPEVHPGLEPAERGYIMAERGDAAKTVSAVKLPLREALGHPLMLGFFSARLLTDSVSFFFSFWLPQYLHTARGFSLAMIGLFGWIPFLAADIGGPGGGALSDWLVRRGWTPTAARRRMLLVAACVMPCSVVAVFAPSASVALALIAVLLAAQSCWMCNILTLMAESFPREHLATYVALASIGGALGGIISTLAAGNVIETVGYVPVFVTLGFLHFTALGILTLQFRRQQAAAR